MKIGLLALGRPTFDVPFAQEMLDGMLSRLGELNAELVGPQKLLLDEAETRDAIADLRGAQPDRLLILQVTFTDAAMVALAARELSCPLSIWSVPEPRIGGRLRLNSFCGLNLASHALGLGGRAFSWLYATPENTDAAALHALFSGDTETVAINAQEVPPSTEQGRQIAARLAGQKIARIGEHPAGFDTCAYEASDLRDLAGVGVEELSLDDLFERARATPPELRKTLRQQAEPLLSCLENVDQEQLDRSLALQNGLQELRSSGDYSAFAIRCWPETFTEYGGAICGPASMMGEARVPCACEADVYGALTQMILQDVADAPVFLTDLVDMDATDDTGVFWHCGQAPVSMCRDDQHPQATVHTNRKQPLLFEFALKPGTITFMRISQARGRKQMILGRGRMLDRPMAFTGTSGVCRFERPAADVTADILASGLEHHVAIAYGDHVQALRGVAGAMNLPVLEI